MTKSYEIEVNVRAEPERIWTALTRPDEISQWFGWDAAGLKDEIKFIFVDHATADPGRQRIDFADTGGQYLEVVSSGANSVVRAVQPGPPAPEGEASDPMAEGWIAFLHQLRRYVEAHHGDHRKTLYLTGSGPAAAIAAAVSGRLPGEDWFRGTYTRVIGTGDFGPGLGVLYTSAPLDSDEEENATLTLSTWGLSETEFFELTSDWLGWWQTLVDGGEAVVSKS